MISDSTKEFIFLVEIPPINSKLGDFERNAKIVSVKMSAKPLEDGKKPINFEANLVLTCYNEDENIPQDSEADENVEYNYLRVMGAEAMKNCMNEAEKGNYD